MDRVKKTADKVEISMAGNPKSGEKKKTTLFCAFNLHKEMKCPAYMKISPVQKAFLWVQEAGLLFLLYLTFSLLALQWLFSFNSHALFQGFHFDSGASDRHVGHVGLRIVSKKRNRN